LPLRSLGLVPAWHRGGVTRPGERGHRRSRTLCSGRPRLPRSGGPASSRWPCRPQCAGTPGGIESAPDAGPAVSADPCLPLRAADVEGASTARRSRLRHSSPRRSEPPVPGRGGRDLRHLNGVSSRPKACAAAPMCSARAGSSFHRRTVQRLSVGSPRCCCSPGQRRPLRSLRAARRRPLRTPEPHPRSTPTKRSSPCFVAADWR